ncbi:MAG: MSMEG_0565 family glycosyltransferase [Janthinobacterium lividum]
MNRPLNISMFAHSTLPRGGVVHALQLGDALASAGHLVTLHAPDVDARGLFRATRCRFAAIAAARVDGSLAALVEQRIGEIITHLEKLPGALAQDIYHAQDPISANALATLVERGLIDGFVRTVHHLDEFSDARLSAWQTRGFTAARQVLCVSRLWRDVLQRDYAIDARLVDNGVDLTRFTPRANAHDALLVQRFGLRGASLQDGTAAGPVFLSIGGIEQRKNPLRALAAFLQVRERFPHAQWLIAGGASLLDHSAVATQFRAAVAQTGIAIGPGAPIVVAGALLDEQMAALYRIADALLFPSLVEGFGLVVLEALASGLPIVVSKIAPFTEYLTSAAVEWADPLDPASIAAAMVRAVSAGGTPRGRLVGQAALDICRRFDWRVSAGRHLDLYRATLARKESEHA